MNTADTIRAATLYKTASIARRYTTPGGAKIARVEWPDKVTVEVCTRGARDSKGNHLPDSWGDAYGTEETRARTIKDKAVEIRMQREANPTSRV